MFELETQEIESIAEKVADRLKPMLHHHTGERDGDTVFDVNGLADYLHVDTSWVYKQVSLKAIPFFKVGKYSRFRKRDIDKWIEGNTVRPIPPFKMVKNRG